MADALEDHEGSVSTGGRAIAGLRFADDIDGCSRRGRTAKIVEPLDKASTAYSIEISAEKTVLMTNKNSGINEEIKVNGQTLESVTSFKYLGSLVSGKGSKPEILSRIAQMTTALIRLKPVWNYRSISLSFRIQVMHLLSHSSSCMLVNHGPSQQSCKAKYKPWN